MIQYVKMQTVSCAVLRPNLNSSDSLSLPGDLEILLVRFTNNVYYYSYFHYLQFVLFTHKQKASGNGRECRSVEEQTKKDN